MKKDAPLPPSSLSTLQRLLRERASRAAEQTAESGAVSHDEVQALQDLAGLCAVVEATAEKPKPKRWMPAVLFALALAFASLLLFVPVGSTEVDLKVSATAAEFRLAEARPLIMAQPALREIRFSRIQELSSIPCPGVETGKDIASLTLAVGEKGGTITLDPIGGIVGLAVTMRATDSPAWWDLEFAGVPLTVTFALEGAVQVETQVCRFSSDFPQKVTATLTTEGSRLTFQLANPSERLFAQLLPVAALSFTRSELVRFGDTPAHAQWSTLLGGSMYFEELGAKESKLREGERLELAFPRGSLQPPQKSGPALDWRFRGSATTLRSGPPDAMRNLKPSWLDHARAQHGFELMWGTALSLFGLVGTLTRWWKSR